MSDDRRRGLLFHERLWPAWWVWAMAVLMGVGFGLIASRIGPLVAVVVATVVSGVLLTALVATTPVVAVQDGTLHAGRAHVPVAMLGGAVALDAAGMRHALGPDLDARAHLCIRGWIPAGVRVVLDDPRDPTPYWLVSSRRPQELAAALRSAAAA